MGTINVMDQVKRYDRADVTCPVDWCGAVREQPCKRRHPGRGVVVSEYCHDSRIKLQREWEIAQGIPKTKWRKFREKPSKPPRGGRGRQHSARGRTRNRTVQDRKTT
jgi:hypothetical protein